MGRIKIFKVGTGIFICLVFVVVFLSSCINQEKSNEAFVEIVAHRGIWREFPENSLEGIEKCIELGVDMVELDIARTKDSVLILMHDTTLDRTTTGQGLVSNHTFQEIRELYLKDNNGEITQFKVPTLEETMLICKGRIKVFIDKGYDNLNQAFQILESSETESQSFFLGFVDGNDFRNDYPKISNKVDYMPLVKPKDSLDEFLSSFAGLKSSYYLFSFDSDNEWLFSKIHELPKGSMAMATTQVDYYCGGHSDSISLKKPDAGWGYLIDQGFGAICTDYPEDLLKYLKKKGLHK